MSFDTKYIALCLLLQLQYYYAINIDYKLDTNV